MIGLTSIPTKRCDSSSSTGSITDLTVHRRSDYLSRKQLQVSVNKSWIDSTADATLMVDRGISSTD